MDKNTRPFYKYRLGLFELKLRQLQKVKSIDSIFISTDHSEIINYVNDNHEIFTKEVIVEPRPSELAVDDCLEDLISYLSYTVPTDILIWTHVTSPFFTSNDYENAIHAYMSNSCDSLVSVSAVHTFALQGGKWISHNPAVRKWPRKQDVEKIFLINGAVYIINIELMRRKRDRIGDNPHYFELHGLSDFDIDYEEDFCMAEKIAPCLLE